MARYSSSASKRECVVNSGNPLLSEQDLSDIAGRASTLYERLAAKSMPPQQVSGEPTAQERLEKWCNCATAGDWEKFKQRLSWDGLDLASARLYLADSFGPQCERKPRWLCTISRLTNFVASWSIPARGHDDYPDHVNAPLPFQELVVPLAGFAKQRLRAAAGESYDLLSGEAHRGLANYLLEELAAFVAQPMYREFCVYRSKRQWSLARLTTRMNEDEGNPLYEQFVGSILHQGFSEFFREYSFLARQIATIIDHWVDSATEFIARLRCDRERLASVFNSNRDLGQVAIVKFGMSDRHWRGRTVGLVTFASGLRIIYKPKPLQLESDLFELLHWFNGHDTPLRMRGLKALNRGCYGWVEFAEQLRCADQGEAKQFFQRMGMLACIAYATGGVDCHCQNIVAAGQHPILVDAETLLHPQSPEDTGSYGDFGAYRLARTQLWNSVFRTGFLPGSIIGLEGTNFDVSGLGGFDQQGTNLRELEWQRTNTDEMTFGYRVCKVSASANLAFLNGNALNPDDHLQDFCTGFQQMYGLFESRKNQILSPECPFGRLSGRRTRVLLRKTLYYAALLKRTMHPDFCHSGIDCAIEWDRLSRRFASARNQVPVAKILKSEHRSLAQLDIPYFAVFSNGTALELESGEQVRRYFNVPAYEASVSRVKEFCTKDLDRQLSFIHSTFHSSTRSRKAMTRTLRDGKPTSLANEPDPFTAEEFVEQAVAIAYGLKEKAICSTDGSATWIGAEYDFCTRQYWFRPLEYSLYSGALGVALFLAAVEACTGARHFEDLALAAIYPLRQQIRNHPAAFARDQSIGGISGLGSIVYGLLRMGKFLRCDALVEESLKAALLITEDKIAADEKLDIMTGAAGALMALLALHEVTSDSSLIARAVNCGKHLVNERRQTPVGSRAWPTLGSKLLTGFSHGAAGIAHALLRLHRAVGGTEFLDAASEGMDYERNVFSEKHGNWPDFRECTASGDPLFALSWCHGAPGIGLSRIACLELTDNFKIREEIEQALAAAGRCDLDDVDHVCCGIAGRADFFLVAGRRLQRSELEKVGRQQVSAILRRAKNNSGFRLIAGVPGSTIYNPGFFQGVAGIGYELLRFADYENSLPSILLMA
jgi:type 2 lantibiotic biosynthesis protein LanM